MLKKTVTPAAAIAGIFAAAVTGYATMMGHHGVGPLVMMFVVGTFIGFVVQKVMNNQD